MPGSMGKWRPGPEKLCALSNYDSTPRARWRPNLVPDVIGQDASRRTRALYISFGLLFGPILPCEIRSFFYILNFFVRFISSSMSQKKNFLQMSFWIQSSLTPRMR